MWMSNLIYLCISNIDLQNKGYQSDKDDWLFKPIHSRDPFYTYTIYLIVFI